MRCCISLAILSFIVLFTACGAESSGKTSDPPKKSVRVVKVSEAKLPVVVAVSGTLAAEEEVVMSFKVQGRISQIFVDLGSHVKRGQPLIELEPADFQLRVQQSQAAYQQARVRLGLPAEGDEQTQINPQDTSVAKQAKAQMDQAKLTRDRRESLFNQGLMSRSEFDDAEAAYQVAAARYEDALEEVQNREGMLFQRRAELDLAKQQFSDSTMRAPMDGAIDQRRVSPGQFVAVGQPALNLVRLHPLRLKLALPEREASGVRQNQEVQVRVEGDSTVYRGVLARLSPAISSDNRTLMVEAEVPNQNGALRPGSFARAEIITQPDHTALLVPESSVITFAGIQKVIAVKKDMTVEKVVKTGRRSGDQIEVVEGLISGDIVVVNPGNLTEGQSVLTTW